MILAPCCVFEDADTQAMWPLFTLKPSLELWVGTSTIFQKYLRRFGQQALSVWVHPDFEPWARAYYSGIPVNRPNHAAPMWFFNSRAWVAPDRWTTLLTQDPSSSVAILAKGQVAALWLHHPHVEKAWRLLSEIPRSQDMVAWAQSEGIPCMDSDLFIANQAWDWLGHHLSILKTELNQTMPLGAILGKVGSLSSLVNEAAIYIDEDAVVEDMVVIDASKGPVAIGKGARIEAFSRLEGPLYVGPNSQILGGKVGNSSIGFYSKIAGEVSKSIISSYSNKAHYGYLGDSYLGSWVNLGAGTTTSNLKNTYTDVCVAHPKTGEKQSAHTQFLGSIIGDHVKTGIGTPLNTGTFVGAGSNLIGTTVHHGSITDLSWGLSGEYTVHQLSRFLKTASAMMARRGLTLTELEASLYEKRLTT